MSHYDAKVAEELGAEFVSVMLQDTEAYRKYRKILLKQYPNKAGNGSGGDGSGDGPPPEDEGDIEPISIEEEMKTSYLDYAMSVIVSRAPH